MSAPHSHTDEVNEIRKLTMEANSLMDSTNLSDLGGDNKMANTPAEIYANVRNRALEEAIAAIEHEAEGWNKQNATVIENALLALRPTIRALKREPE